MMNLKSDYTKYVKVTSKLPKGFNFPLPWRNPNKSKGTFLGMLFVPKADNDVELRRKDWLDVSEVIILQNIFKYCLKGTNPNGLKEVNLPFREGSVAYYRTAWLYGAKDESTKILLGEATKTLDILATYHSYLQSPWLLTRVLSKTGKCVYVFL
ncbi:hypothetical protein V6N12_031352 [Hibiscus sabdariffa]|uniref:Uncharacterized protein n=1 Tax=Hibiscus sabdariffa TaxID=183260 RepID=A0ABR2EAK2_9ROSI